MPGVSLKKCEDKFWGQWRDNTKSCHKYDLGTHPGTHYALTYISTETKLVLANM